MAGSYNYISWTALEDALLERLQDTSAINTSRADATACLTEALRVLNAFTAAGTSGQWAIDYLFDFSPGDTWKSLNVSGSPRERTVTDADIITQMERMLYEPPSGLTWTGTTQFSIANLSNALQFRRDELLQLTGANTVNLTQFSPLMSMRTYLPDSTLDLRRVRMIPDSSVTSESPYALGRADITSTNAYGELKNIQPGTPDSWLITANSPLAFDCSCPPNFPGTWDMLALYAENALTPPTPSVLGLPDDWCWVAMYGALADALSNSPESTDILRARYCRMRYDRGAKAMMALPWLLAASVADLPVGTPSYKAMDAWAQNWENTWPASDPQIVVGGMDFIALAPFATTATVSSVLRVVGNAPVDPTAPVQLSRDAIEAVLAYAQHVASFKLGGADFQSTLSLLEQFESFCALQNRRFAALGIFRPEMLQEGDRADALDPRFGPPVKEAARHGK